MHFRNVLCIKLLGTWHRNYNLRKYSVVLKAYVWQGLNLFSYLFQQGRDFFEFPLSAELSPYHLQMLLKAFLLEVKYRGGKSIKEWKKQKFYSYFHVILVSIIFFIFFVCIIPNKMMSFIHSFIKSLFNAYHIQLVLRGLLLSSWNVHSNWQWKGDVIEKIHSYENTYLFIVLL